MSAPDLPATDLLHIARSQFLDAFATVEEAVGRWLSDSGTPHNATMGQRIEALRAIKPSPAYSKAMRAELHAVLDRLAALNSVRCDIAHSRLHAVRLEREYYACFVNPRHRDGLGMTARLLGREQFQTIAEELRALAERIALPGVKLPPSSPPRPSPGAAGDP